MTDLDETEISWLMPGVEACWGVDHSHGGQHQTLAILSASAYDRVSDMATYTLAEWDALDDPADDDDDDDDDEVCEGVWVVGADGLGRWLPAEAEAGSGAGAGRVA